MITTIPDYLMIRLWDVFPESFKAVKHESVPVNPYRQAGRLGMVESTECRDEITVLAFEILGTAKAFTHDGNFPDDGLKYIDSYKSKKSQAQALKEFFRKR